MSEHPSPTWAVSESAYTRGCRCDGCKAAQRQGCKDRRARDEAEAYRPPVQPVGVRVALPPSLNWRRGAACAQFPAEMFFPAKGGSVREPMRVCAECFVQGECLAEALSDPSISGVWGGTTDRQRMRMRASA